MSDNWFSFSDEPTRCDICDVEVVECHRCRRCHSIWCLKCEHPKTYECSGSNHSYSESCCDLCIPKYGRLIDGPAFTTLYYCPHCAPKTSQPEYDFKNAVNFVSRKVLRQYKYCRGLDVEYLNDPFNWERYEREPEKVEKEWIEMMITREK